MKQGRIPRFRRIIIRAIVFLLLGAVVNIAVAWSLALTIPLYDGQMTRGQRCNDGEVWDLQKWSNFTGVGLYSARLYVSGIAHEGIGPDPHDFVPWWSGLNKPTTRFAENRLKEVEVREAEARGWPMVAMWSETEYFPRMGNEVRGGIRTPFAPWRRGDARLPKVLPLKFIWPAFAINTIFYASIFRLLFTVTQMLRRRRRIRRGLCPACAYPTGVSPVCTECGHAMSNPTGA